MVVVLVWWLWFVLLRYICLLFADCVLVCGCICLVWAGAVVCLRTVWVVLAVCFATVRFVVLGVLICILVCVWLFATGEFWGGLLVCLLLGLRYGGSVWV